MISTVRSVDPPSITMYSTCGYVCPATLRIVCSMNASLLNDGVTMLTSGRPAREPRRSNAPLFRSRLTIRGQSRRRVAMVGVDTQYYHRR